MDPQVFLVAGLGFGDEGKGATVDYLVRKHNAGMVVRYNGGAQAAHNVVLPDGRHHTFSQFGSGTFVPGVKTFLSKFMVVNPLSLIKEGKHLESLGVSGAFNRVIVDGDALITTPYHVAANRLREWMRGPQRHGSCGMGVGETVEDFRDFGPHAIFAKDLKRPGLLRRKLDALRRRKLLSFSQDVQLLGRTPVGGCLNLLMDESSVSSIVSDYQAFSSRVQISDISELKKFLENGKVVFEGAQGMLLDRTFGFFPHITKTDISFTQAESLLEEVGFKGGVKKIGVLRSYATRHGAGPFVTEDSELSVNLVEPHNGNGDWQGKFRMGYFDAVAVKYSLDAIKGVDEIALTHVDVASQFKRMQICTGYETPDGSIAEIVPNEDLSLEEKRGLTDKIKSAQPVFQVQGGLPQYLAEIGRIVKVPITSFAFGPTFKDRFQDITALL